jgi:hypothetical protein
VFFSLAHHHCLDKALWGIEVTLIQHAHAHATAENYLARIRSHSAGEESNEA